MCLVSQLFLSHCSVRLNKSTALKWNFFFIKRSMNYGTFHINAIFFVFGMGSTRLFFKSRVTVVTQAKSNISHPSFFSIYKPVLDPKGLTPVT
jgi:hypothetical protein